MTTATEVQPAPEPVMASRDREELELVEPEPEAEPEAAPVEDARAAIYARASEQRTEEIAQSLTDFPDGNGEVIIENGESTDILQTTPQAATPPDAVEMVEVKVLGTIRSVSKDKVDAQGGVENFQIRAAAKEQMERNAHERSELAERQIAQDERERLWNAQQAAIPTPDSREGQPPERSTPTDGQTLEDSARRYQDAVYDDAAEAPSIFVQAVKTAADAAVKEAMKVGQPFDEAALRKRVKEELAADNRRAKVETAGQALISKHPELQQRSDQYDKRMYDNINRESIVVAAEHPEWEPADVLAEAHERISNWKGGPQSETMSDKQARKQATTRPRTGTQRYTPPPPAPRATNKDYVAQERKRRGLD